MAELASMNTSFERLGRALGYPNSYLTEVKKDHPATAILQLLLGWRNRYSFKIFYCLIMFVSGIFFHFLGQKVKMFAEFHHLLTCLKVFSNFVNSVGKKLTNVPAITRK